VAGVLLALIAVVAQAAPPALTVVSWGGAYERSQNEAYFKPFTAVTGIPVIIRQYNGGIEELRDQVGNGAVSWDVVDLVKADNLRACDAGLLEEMDHDTLASSPDGVLARQDFLPAALDRCGVSHVVYSTVLAFDTRAFPGVQPRSVDALFDLKKFPGKRALQKEPIAVMEWALRSYGVPRQDIYNLLSTERGIDLAFRKLDQIKEQIVWWQDGSEPAALLRDRKVTIASGFNGRFFDAMINQRQPLQVIWDGQLLEYSTWGIPRGAPNARAAREFVQFATRTAQLARQAEYIAYGPTRLSSMDLIGQHAESGLDIHPYLPTSPANLVRGIMKDYEWYARTYDQLKARFDRWLIE